MRLPQPPPRTDSAVQSLVTRPDFRALLSAVGPTLEDGRYLHWDALRRREAPVGLSAEQWWAVAKLCRGGATPVEPMQTAYPNIPFAFARLPQVARALHSLDRLSVVSQLDPALLDDAMVSQYRARQLIEEAISSSVLEGARPTTRELARKMVREQRPPESRDECMIVGNWLAMRHILELRDEGRPLDVDGLLHLHRIIGQGALEVPGSEGTFRGAEHEVRVQDVEGTIWHVPPSAEGLSDRVAALLRFASEDSNQAPGPFIHPVIRAIIVHFWLAYEHPFRDGNGRVARALFYYCMLRSGYDLAEFLSISGPIDRSPGPYYLAFRYTETDEGDLTYFILHQLGVIQQAVDDLIAQVGKQVSETRRLARAVATMDELGPRQRALLRHATAHPLETYTIEGHAAAHSVHYQTARNDLVDLVSRGLVEVKRVGNGKRYRPSERLLQTLR